MLVLAYTYNFKLIAFSQKMMWFLYLVYVQGVLNLWEVKFNIKVLFVTIFTANPHLQEVSWKVFNLALQCVKLF